MDELNELTMVDENETAMNGEVEATEEAEVKYVDAGVVLAVGAVGGALALKGAQMVWNCKLVKKMRNAAATKADAIHESIKARSEERKRKKLTKVKTEVVDAEFISHDDAVNE